MKAPKRHYFGTDGIRGKANQSPVTAEIALKVGMAAGAFFRRGNHRHRVVIAKDTRLSGYLIEPALTAGFVAVGMDVILVGPMPTPAVAMLVKSLRADLGVMISASHNPYDDNGIKLFGPDGYKLSDEDEMQIEALMAGDLDDYRVVGDRLGRAKRLEDAPGRYIEYVKATFPKDMRLDGMKVVLDCANGAAYRVAPVVLWELGAEVISIGVKPDGTNINKDCGSTHPAPLQAAVREHGADLGIALDGDADRLIMCDEEGELVDGDQLLAMVTSMMHKRGQLKGGGVVSTVMANLGFEDYIKQLGLALHRTAVGDRYVMQKMRESGCNIGGEPSGHIILSDHTTTGDGLLAALQVLAMVRYQQAESQLQAQTGALRPFIPVPQTLINIPTRDLDEKGKKALENKVEDVSQLFGERGMVVMRPSGTEPLVRVMLQCKDAGLFEEGIKAVRKAAGLA
ncbi:phosphoglucosamine mutase [bacterium]|nr:phosphoglucosamine mutase [bacterium]